MKRLWIRIVRKAAGVLVVLAGILGLAFPIFPGWLLIGIGLYILAADSPAITRFLAALRRRFSLIDMLFRPLDRHLAPRADDTGEEESAASGEHPERGV